MSSFLVLQNKCFDILSNFYIVGIFVLDWGIMSWMQQGNANQKHI